MVLKYPMLFILSNAIRCFKINFIKHGLRFFPCLSQTQIRTNDRVFVNCSVSGLYMVWTMWLGLPSSMQSNITSLVTGPHTSADLWLKGQAAW